MSQRSQPHRSHRSPLAARAGQRDHLEKAVTVISSGWLGCYRDVIRMDVIVGCTDVTRMDVK